MKLYLTRPKTVRRQLITAGLLAVLLAGCATTGAEEPVAGSNPATMPPATVSTTAGAPAPGDGSVPAVSSPSTVAEPSTAPITAAQPLVVTTGFAVDDLDPIENGFWGNEFGYSELLLKPDLSGTPTPWLLQDLTNLDDLNWQLTLHEGIAFQNGGTLDATALKAAMDYQLVENPSLVSAMGEATIAVHSPTELTVTTARPTPNMANILASEGMFKVYDQAAYLKAKGDPAQLLAAKLYTGPYLVDSLTPERMDLTPNPDYWNGTPGLSDLTVLFVPEAQARILAVQAGEADLALYPPTASAVSFTGRDDSFYLTGTPTGPTFQFVPNLADPILADVDVRRALYAAIDYRELAEDVMDGLYRQAIGLYADSVPWAETTQTTDSVAAGALLTAAGWIPGEDGVREKDGKTLTLEVLTYPQQPDSDMLAVAVQAQLKAVGVDLQIRQVPDITAEMEDGGWQLAITGNGFISSGGDPISPLQNYLHTDGSRNTGKVADAELDALIDEVSVTIDQEKRYDLLGQIQHLVADSGYLGYLGMRLPNAVAGERMRDYQIPTGLIWVDATTVVTN